MKLLVRILNIIIFVFLVSVFTPTLRGEVTDLSSDYLNVIQQNRTVVTCYDDSNNVWGGQGTITQVDQTGVWVTTAGHVAHDSTYCDVMFRDGSTHTAHLAKQFDKSDISILFLSRAYWPTHASIAPLKIGAKLVVFGQITQSPVQGPLGDLLGFMFVFNDTTYDGIVLSRMPAALIRYPVAKENLVLTNLFSRPGSSGGGAFDEKGNLVALVSGGAMYDAYITYVVDINQSFEQEFALHPEEANYVKVH